MTEVADPPYDVLPQPLGDFERLGVIMDEAFAECVADPDAFRRTEQAWLNDHNPSFYRFTAIFFELSQKETGDPTKKLIGILYAHRVLRTIAGEAYESVVMPKLVGALPGQKVNHIRDICNAEPDEQVALGRVFGQRGQTISDKIMAFKSREVRDTCATTLGLIYFDPTASTEESTLQSPALPRPEAMGETMQDLLAEIRAMPPGESFIRREREWLEANSPEVLAGIQLTFEKTVESLRARGLSETNADAYLQGLLYGNYCLRTAAGEGYEAIAAFLVNPERERRLVSFIGDKGDLTERDVITEVIGASNAPIVDAIMELGHPMARDGCSYILARAYTVI